MQFSIILLLPSTALAPTICSLHRCHSLDYNQVFKFRKLLPCPCTAPCSELPGSGWAAWAAVACTPPERKSQKKRGDDEALPQRDRYVMERLMRTTLREESRGGEKRGGETESHSAEEGKRGYERQRESKSFSQLHRDRLSDLNCVLCTSQGLQAETLGAPVSQLEATAGFLGKWAEDVMSSGTEHFHGNRTSQ